MIAAGVLGVLLTAAGLASRSASMMTVDLGFESRNTAGCPCQYGGSARTPEAHRAMSDQVRDAFTRIPGVQSASYFGFPSVGARARARFSAAGARDLLRIGPDYLKMLGLRLIAGRALERRRSSRRDAGRGRQSERGRCLWPGQVAVGQTMLFGPERQAVEIVGVVANAFVIGFNPERPDPKPNYVFVTAHSRRVAAVTRRLRVIPCGPGDFGEITFYVRARWRRRTRCAAIGPALRESIVVSPSRSCAPWTSSSKA